jgi:hypothetical protein
VLLLELLHQQELLLVLRQLLVQVLLQELQLLELVLELLLFYRKQPEQQPTTMRSTESLS